ncbi:MAG: hypothetical protein ABJL67_08095 [Sulfitobacter sp.]
MMVFDLTKDKQQNARLPTFWLSEEELLLIGQNDIVKRSFDHEPNVDVLFRMPQELADNHVFHRAICVSENLWAVGLTKQEGSMRTGGGMLFIEVADADISRYERRSVTLGETTNPFDCKAVSNYGVEVTVPATRPKAADIKSKIQRSLVSSKDAQNLHLANDLGQSVIDYEKAGKKHRIILGAQGPRPNQWSKVTKDHGTPRYLFYPGDSDHGGKPEKWPMTVWIADFDRHTARSLELPMGPWVGDHPERLRCFSCGCGCYREQVLYLIGSKIYAHVWGIGYPKSARAIFVYDLNSTGTDWRRVTNRGNILSPVFSESGCKLAYFEDELKTLCERYVNRDSYCL